MFRYSKFCYSAVKYLSGGFLFYFKVLVDKEHLRSEVKKMTERMQEYTKEMAAKMDEERAIVRKECGREIDELNQRVY